MEFKYDVIVIGAGHAGCEAAAAAANLGSKTCLITMDMNKIGQMSCNPAVGGIAKGQIVREIDALGGYMGLVTDKTAIQFRILNRSKGPAMWSPRAQCDRGKFIWAWREILENIPNLHIWQDTVNGILVENGEVTGVKTVWGVTFHASRYLPERTDARRTNHAAWRTNGRTRFLRIDRIYRTARHYLWPYENRYAGTHRWTKRSLRLYGDSRWRSRFPQVLIHEYRHTSSETVALLDMLHQRRNAPDTA